jgi:DNA-binding NtrC family response regulator
MAPFERKPKRSATHSGVMPSEAPSHWAIGSPVGPGLPDVLVPHVLVADDEASVRNLVARLLGSSIPSSCIHLAASGEEAMGILHRQPLLLVLSDFRMPGLTGVDVLASARRLQPWAGRLLMTGHADTRVALDAINDAKVEAFVRKPWEAAAFVSTVQRLLREHRALVRWERAQLRALDTLQRQVAGACQN